VHTKAGERLVFYCTSWKGEQKLAVARNSEKSDQVENLGNLCSISNSSK